MANGNGNRPTWAALSGSWSFGGSGVDAEYTGSEEAPQPVGVALASRRLRTGRASAEITLGDSQENAGRLLIGHNTVTGGYHSAGLRGYDRAYVIDEHVPGRGWEPVAYRGRARHLDGSRAYSVTAEVSGQRLRLTSRVGWAPSGAGGDDGRASGRRSSAARVVRPSPPAVHFRVEQRCRILVGGRVAANGVARRFRQSVGLRQQQRQRGERQHAGGESSRPSPEPADSRRTGRSAAFAAPHHDTGSKRTPPNASQAAIRVSTRLNAWPTT